jgi:enoyl-[acyl-carrier protein] reductase I
MGLFDGKKGIVLGVFNDRSIAWDIAQVIMAEGGTIGFSHMPDAANDERKKNTRRLQQLLEPMGEKAKFFHPMDVQKDEDIAAFMGKAGDEFGKIDFMLHSIAYADPTDLKKSTIECSRAGFKLAMDISAYSLIATCAAARPILAPGASILTLTYYGGEKCVPGYNIMGVCKATLDASMKYLAFDLGPMGVRVNALSAGPVLTVSGKGAGVDEMLQLYDGMAPLGRNVSHEEVGKTGAFLLSDMSNGITAEILHVDCGYNVMGSPGRLLDRFKEKGAQAT